MSNAGNECPGPIKIEPPTKYLTILIPSQPPLNLNILQCNCLISTYGFNNSGTLPIVDEKTSIRLIHCPVCSSIFPYFLSDYLLMLTAQRLWLGWWWGFDESSYVYWLSSSSSEPCKEWGSVHGGSQPCLLFLDSQLKFHHDSLSYFVQERVRSNSQSTKEDNAISFILLFFRLD